MSIHIILISSGRGSPIPFAAFYSPCKSRMTRRSCAHNNKEIKTRTLCLQLIMEMQLSLKVRLGTWTNEDFRIMGGRKLFQIPCSNSSLHFESHWDVPLLIFTASLLRRVSKYQPSGEGGTRSPPATPHCLQNPKWPPGGPKMANGVWKGV